MTVPAVSVVIPTYQRRDPVRRAVESVLEQTFGDFELIVVDDGSTDGTEEALRGLDPRLRYEWRENRGVAAARNVALRIARAPIVAFLDSDNRWRSHHLETVTAALAHHPEAALVTTCPRLRRRGDAATWVADVLPDLLLANVLTVTTCVAVRRRALLDVGGFDERMEVGEDADLWRRLAIRYLFCLAPADTVEVNRLPDSLRERGVREGTYLEVHKLSAEVCLEAIRRERPDAAPELMALARGRLRLLEGLAALREEDEATARVAFREALTLAPALATEPRALRSTLTLAAPAGRTRRHYLAFVVGAWRGHPAFARSELE